MNASTNSLQFFDDLFSGKADAWLLVVVMIIVLYWFGIQPPEQSKAAIKLQKEAVE